MKTPFRLAKALLVGDMDTVCNVIELTHLSEEHAWANYIEGLVHYDGDEDRPVLAFLLERWTTAAVNRDLVEQTVVEYGS